MTLPGKSILLAPAALMSKACFMRPMLSAEITPTSDSRQVAGWFSTEGECSRSRISSYNPYVSNEEAKCVTVMNDTGERHSRFTHLDGQRVIYTSMSSIMTRYRGCRDMILKSAQSVEFCIMSPKRPASV